MDFKILKEDEVTLSSHRNMMLVSDADGQVCLIGLAFCTSLRGPVVIKVDGSGHTWYKTYLYQPSDKIFNTLSSALNDFVKCATFTFPNSSTTSNVKDGEPLVLSQKYIFLNTTYTCQLMSPNRKFTGHFMGCWNWIFDKDITINVHFATQQDSKYTIFLYPQLEYKGIRSFMENFKLSPCWESCDLTIPGAQEFCNNRITMFDWTSPFLTQTVSIPEKLKLIAVIFQILLTEDDALEKVTEDPAVDMLCPWQCLLNRPDKIAHSRMKDTYTIFYHLYSSLESFNSRGDLLKEIIKLLSHHKVDLWNILVTLHGEPVLDIDLLRRAFDVNKFILEFIYMLCDTFIDSVLHMFQMLQKWMLASSLHNMRELLSDKVSSEIYQHLIANVYFPALSSDKRGKLEKELDSYDINIEEFQRLTVITITCLMITVKNDFGQWTINEDTELKIKQIAVKVIEKRAPEWMISPIHTTFQRLYGDDASKSGTISKFQRFGRRKTRSTVGMPEVTYVKGWIT